MNGGQRVFAGLVCGAAAGLALSRWAPGSVEAVAAVAKPVGTLWLHALQMTVVPLVVSLIVVGVSQAADVAAGGRIARRALAWPTRRRQRQRQRRPHRCSCWHRRRRRRRRRRTQGW